MNFFKNIFLSISVLLLSYISSGYFGYFYKVISRDHGTWINLSSLVGIFIGYVFFLPLIFTIFGDAKKYWWIIILLIPVVLFEIYFDWHYQAIYIPIVLGILGWGIGFLISKLAFRR